MRPGGVTNTQSISDNLGGGDPNAAYPPDGSKYRVGQYLHDMSTAPPTTYVFSDTPVGSGNYSWEFAASGIGSQSQTFQFSGDIPAQLEAAGGAVADGGNAPDYIPHYPVLVATTLLDYSIVIDAAPPEINETNARLIIGVGQLGAINPVVIVPYPGIGIASGSNVAVPITPGDVVDFNWAVDLETSAPWQFAAVVRLHN